MIFALNRNVKTIKLQDSDLKYQSPTATVSKTPSNYARNAILNQYFPASHFNYFLEMKI